MTLKKYSYLKITQKKAKSTNIILPSHFCPYTICKCIQFMGGRTERNINSNNQFRNGGKRWEKSDFVIFSGIHSTNWFVLQPEQITFPVTSFKSTDVRRIKAEQRQLGGRRPVMHCSRRAGGDCLASGEQLKVSEQGNSVLNIVVLVCQALNVCVPPKFFY